MVELLQLHTYRTGTTTWYFSDGLQNNPDFEIYTLYPAYVLKNPAGIILDISNSNFKPITTYDSANTETLWYFDDSLNSLYDNNILYNQLTTYSQNNNLQIITGHCFFQDSESVFTQQQQTRIREGFTINSPSITANTNYVFFEQKLIDDSFVSVKLEKNFNVLNNLRTKNALVNEWPEQVAKTGVVFGKLEATQKLFDDDGNRIKIPLRNVPVGIFNSSDEFPTVVSVDGAGDRIRMHYDSFYTPNQYFNEESFLFDSAFTKNAFYLIDIPQHFKYTTITNENGEFIFYDIPVGANTLFFEVDLLKQGLTKDEVQLNFFPYPGDDRPNIDSVPHFFFRQIPIDVVASWGNLQSGYTEVNVSVNLDLRKWVTMYVSPISYAGEDLVKLQSLGDNKPLTIKVHDMAVFDKTTGYKDKNIPIVEVHDLFNRDTTQQLCWYNEFAQVKNEIKFYGNQYTAFKLPANMYDPNAYRTDCSGFTRSGDYFQKGVWLAGYQLKMFYASENNNYRTTGFFNYWYANKNGSRDHFHMNKTNDFLYNYSNNYYGYESQLDPSNDIYSAVPLAPYDRKWSINYPEKYKIPQIPNELNPDYPLYYDFVICNGYVLEIPKYLDGDLVGRDIFNGYNYPMASDTSYPSFTPSNIGGYGINFNAQLKDYSINDFAKQVTNFILYKYEENVYNDETYSCGYTPQEPDRLSIVGITKNSHVKNGEKYQRLECGYAYWLRPSNYPRVANHPSIGEALFKPDIDHSTENGTWTDPNWSGIQSEDICYLMRSVTSYSIKTTINDVKTKIFINFNGTDSKGSLDFYRIIDPSANHLNENIRQRIPYFSKLYLESYMISSCSPGFRRLTGLNYTASMALNYRLVGSYGTCTEDIDSNDEFQGYSWNELFDSILFITIKNTGEAQGAFYTSSLNSIREILEPNEIKTISIPPSGFIFFEANSNFDIQRNGYLKSNYYMEYSGFRLNNSYNQIAPGIGGNLNADSFLRSEIGSLNVDDGTYHTLTRLKDINTYNEDDNHHHWDVNVGLAETSGIAIIQDGSHGSWTDSMKFIKNDEYQTWNQTKIDHGLGYHIIN